MHLDTRTWLANFDGDDIPSMSAAEILHRIAALRETEDTPHFLYKFPVKEEDREWVARRNRETLNGSAGFEIYVLMEELKRRGLVHSAETQPPEGHGGR